MGLFVSKLNHKYKQQPQQQYETSKKIQKLNGNESPAVAIESRSITYIYYDCLERILDRLDLQDLLNLAQTCKRLQIAAAANFKDRHGGKEIVLIPKNNANDFKGLHWDVNHIYVFDVTFCLPFLRCFGAKMGDLQIIHSSPHVAHHYVDMTTNRYCADTLASITYIGAQQQFSNEAFQKPFKRVESVCIMYGNVLPQFIDWFPNLRELSIDDWSMHKSIAVCLPSLQRLNIVFTSASTEKYVETFLRLNKQLQTLEIDITHDDVIKMSDLLDMFSENTAMSRWEVYKWIDSNLFVDVHEKDLLQLANEHPGMTVLDLLDCVLVNGDDAAWFFCQMESLKWFRFRIKEQSEYDSLLKKLGDNWEYELSIDENNDTQIIILEK